MVLEELRAALLLLVMKDEAYFFYFSSARNLIFWFIDLVNWFLYDYETDLSSFIWSRNLNDVFYLFCMLKFCSKFEMFIFGKTDLLLWSNNISYDLLCAALNDFILFLFDFFIPLIVISVPLKIRFWDLESIFLLIFGFIC